MIILESETHRSQPQHAIVGQLLSIADQVDALVTEKQDLDKQYRQAFLLEMIELCETLANGWGDPAEESGMYRVKHAIENLL